MLNQNSGRISAWIQSTADTDPANPFIVTRSFWATDLAFDMDAWAATDAWWKCYLYTLGNGGPGTTTGDWLTLLYNQYRVYRLDLQWRFASGQGLATGVDTYIPVTPPVGARSRAGSTRASQPLSLLIRHQTATPGRKGRGRMYMPGASGDFSDTGAQVTDATLTANLAAYNTNQGVDLTDTSAAAVPMKWGLLGSDGTNRTITGASLAPTAGVQRRRLR